MKIETLKTVVKRCAEAVAVVVLLAVLPACAQDYVAADDSGGADQAPASADQASEMTPPADSYKVLSLQDLKGLLEAQRGKVAVVNFWATWCPPCVKELPEFAEFYKDHQSKKDDVVFLSVSADHPDTLESTLKPFVAKKKLPFPIYLMDFVPSQELTEVLGYEWVGGNLPATFVYDPEGHVRNVWFVGITKVDIEKAVAKIKKAAA